MPIEIVTYNAEEFVKCCMGEGIEYARRYVKENPKERYSTDDFAEVYRMKEREEGWKIDPWAQKLRRGPDVNYGHPWDDTVEWYLDIYEGE